MAVDLTLTPLRIERYAGSLPDPQLWMPQAPKVKKGPSSTEGMHANNLVIHSRTRMTESSFPASSAHPTLGSRQFPLRSPEASPSWSNSSGPAPTFSNTLPIHPGPSADDLGTSVTSNASIGSPPEQRMFPGVVHERARRDSLLSSTTAE